MDGACTFINKTNQRVGGKPTLLLRRYQKKVQGFKRGSCHKKPLYFNLFYAILHKLNHRRYFKDNGLWLLHGNIHSKDRVPYKSRKMIKDI
jgi:hypothetical protein